MCTRTQLVALLAETGKGRQEIDAILVGHGHNPMTEGEAIELGIAAPDTPEAILASLSPAETTPETTPETTALRDAAVAILHKLAAVFKTAPDKGVIAEYRQLKDAGDKAGAYRLMTEYLVSVAYVPTAHADTPEAAHALVAQSTPVQLAVTALLHDLVEILRRTNLHHHVEYKQRKAAGTIAAKRDGYIYACRALIDAIY